MIRTREEESNANSEWEAHKRLLQSSSSEKHCMARCSGALHANARFNTLALMLEDCLGGLCSTPSVSMRLSARTVVTAMDAQGAVIRLTAAQQSVAVTAHMVHLMVVLNGASGVNQSPDVVAHSQATESASRRSESCGLGMFLLDSGEVGGLISTPVHQYDVASDE